MRFVTFEYCDMWPVSGECLMYITFIFKLGHMLVFIHMCSLKCSIRSKRKSTNHKASSSMIHHMACIRYHSSERLILALYNLHSSKFNNWWTTEISNVDFLVLLSFDHLQNVQKCTVHWPTSSFMIIDSEIILAIVQYYVNFRVFTMVFLKCHSFILSVHEILASLCFSPFSFHKLPLFQNYRYWHMFRLPPAR